MRTTVSVPATAANVGPGFDSFGLALDIRNVVVADTDAPPGITWSGEGDRELPTDGTDLLSETMRAVADRMGERLPPVCLRAENRIPLARGLGSSSAAIVAGIVLASAVLDLGIHRDLRSVFALAAELEGHPDNAAPAVFGGFTVALPDGEVRRYDTHPDLTPVSVIVPQVQLRTDRARAALPAAVPLADAVFNVAHAAVLVEALTTDPALLRVALRDRLHQRTRLELVPDIREIFESLERSGIPVCVSGAGPSLLVFNLPTNEPFEVEGADVFLAALSATGFEVTDG